MHLRAATLPGTFEPLFVPGTFFPYPSGSTRPPFCSRNSIIPPPGSIQPRFCSRNRSPLQLLWVISPTVVFLFRWPGSYLACQSPIFPLPGSYRSCRQRASVPSHPELGADIARNRRTQCPAVVPIPARPIPVLPGPHLSPSAYSVYFITDIY